jgi:hypothetical protein
MFIAAQPGRSHKAAMPVGLIFAAALFGQANDGAAAAATPSTTAPTQCSPAAPDPNNTQIVICAPKPQGYRIDPDVLAAKRAKKEALAGRPKPPENYKDHSCAVVGPAPCMDAPMISLLGAVATAAEMGRRLAKGQEIGSMFVTEPQSTEYELYQEAKKRRETKETDAAAEKLKKASQTSSTAKSP